MLRILVCAPNHAGTLNQALGVAEAFECLLGAAVAGPQAGDGEPGPVRIRRFGWQDDVGARSGLRWLRAAPDFAVSCGRSGERKGRRLKMTYPDLQWVHIERLKEAGIAPDLHAIPAHDWIEGDARSGAIRLAGVPHRITATQLAGLRGKARATLQLGPAEQLTTVLIGGENEAFDYGTGVLARIEETLLRHRSFEQTRILLLTSRRTPSSIKAACEKYRSASVSLLSHWPELDYFDALAAADGLAVTEDSISMTCEAVATGRPVELIRLDAKPGARLEKFRRFQSEWKPFLVDDAHFADAKWGGPSIRLPDDARAIATRMVEMLDKRA